MKSTIFNRVPRTEVPNRFPLEFKGFINIAVLKDDQYTVIVFPGSKGTSTTIINSKTLVKALNKAGNNGEKVVVAAHEFTKEAYAILKEQNAIVFSGNEFHWTDESINAIRQK